MRALRKEKHWLIKQLANAATVGEDKIERLEAGAAATLETLYSVGRALNVSVAALVADDAVPVDVRREALAKIGRILGQHPAQDVRDVLAIVEKVLTIKARAKRRESSSGADG
mgnify:FL=1